MNSMRIESADGRTAFEPGEKMIVVAEWSLVERPESIEIRLVWNTRGKGDTDVEVVDVKSIDAPPAHDKHRAEFLLPTEPYSFSGKLISLIWGLELIALPSNEAARLDITIAPGGREVVLQKDEFDQ